MMRYVECCTLCFHGVVRYVQCHTLGFHHDGVMRYVQCCTLGFHGVMRDVECHIVGCHGVMRHVNVAPSQTEGVSLIDACS